MDPLTPSKEQRKLLQKRVQEQQQSGSVKLHQAASAYYFGDVPKTPHTSSKKKNIEETPTSTTTSSSSSSGDELNLSTLSDTTELTASNFVFAASARQRWAALQNTTANHNKLALSKASTSKNNNSNHILLSPPSASVNGQNDPPATIPTPVAPPVQQQQQQLLLPSSLHHPTTTTPLSTSSPSMRSRIVADVGGLLRLTSSLKKGKQKKFQGNNTSRRQSSLLLPPLPLINNNDTTYDFAVRSDNENNTQELLFLALGDMDIAAATTTTTLESGSKENTIPYTDITTIPTINEKKRNHHDDHDRILTVYQEEDSMCKNNSTSKNTSNPKDSPARNTRRQQKLRRLSSTYQKIQKQPAVSTDYEKNVNVDDADGLAEGLLIDKEDYGYQKKEKNPDSTNIISVLPKEHGAQESSHQEQNEDRTSDSAVGAASLDSLLNGLGNIGKTTTTLSSTETLVDSILPNPSMVIHETSVEDTRSQGITTKTTKYYSDADNSPLQIRNSSSCQTETVSADAKFNKAIHSLTTEEKESTSDVIMESFSPSELNPTSTPSTHQQKDEVMTVDSAVSVASLNSLLDGLVDEEEHTENVKLSTNESSYRLTADNNRVGSSSTLDMLDSPARNTRSQQKSKKMTNAEIVVASPMQMSRSPSRNTKPKTTRRSNDTPTKMTHLSDSPINTQSPARSRPLSSFHHYGIDSFNGTGHHKLDVYISPPSQKQVLESLPLAASPARQRIIDTSKLMVFDSPSRSTRLQKERLSHIMLALDNSTTKSVASSSSSSSLNIELDDNITNNVDDKCVAVDESQMTGSTARSSSMDSLLLGHEESNMNEYDMKQLQLSSEPTIRGNQFASIASPPQNTYFSSEKGAMPSLKYQEADNSRVSNSSYVTASKSTNPSAVPNDSPARNTRSSIKKANFSSSVDKHEVINRLTADTSELRSLLGDYQHASNDVIDSSTNSMEDCEGDEQPLTVDLRDYHDLFELTLSSSDSTIQKERTSMESASRKSNIGPMKNPNIGLATINEDKRQDFSEFTASTDKLKNAASSKSLTNDHLLPVPTPVKEKPSVQKEPLTWRKSILNSGRNASRNDFSPYTRKTVAFGSPEAAEYNLGSPSVNMTPIPPEIAKVRFSIPRSANTLNSSSPSVSNDDIAIDTDTSTFHSVVPLEGDINALLLTAQSSCFGLSPATGSDSIRDTMKPVNLHHRSDGQGLDSIRVLSPSILPLQSDSSSEAMDCDESLNSNDQHPSKDEGKGLDNIRVSSPSTLSSQPDGSNEAMDCDESLNSNDEHASKVMLQDHTVELELDVFSLLKSADMRNFETLAYTDSSPQREQNMEACYQDNLLHCTDGAAVGQAIVDDKLHSVQHDVHAAVDGNDFTVELERDVGSLLASKRFFTVEGSSICKFPEQSEDSSGKQAFAIGETTLLQVAEEVEPTAELDSHVEDLINACIDTSTISTAIHSSPIVNLEATQTSQSFEPEQNIEFSDSLIDSFVNISGSKLEVRSQLNYESPDTFSAKTNNEGSETSICLSLSAHKKSPFSTAEIPCTDTTQINDNASDQELPSYNRSPLKLTVHLTPAQLMSAIPSFEPKVDDYFLNSCLLLSETTDKEVLQATSSFIFEASAEIEKMVSETSCEGQKYLSDAIEVQAELMADLERKLHSAGSVSSNEISEQLKDLAYAVCSQVAGEWSSWETQLTEALMQAIDPAYDGTRGENIEHIESYMKTVDNVKEAAILLEQKSSKRARRRSLNRRKGEASRVLDDIQLLDAQLQHSIAHKKLIEKYQSSLESLVHLKKSFDCNSSIVKERSLAEASERRYKIQEALSCWLPTSLSGKELVINFAGRSSTNKYVCLEFTAFLPVSDERIVCNAIVLPQQQDRQSFHYFSHEVILFLNHRLTSLCQEIKEMQLPLITDLSSSVQYIDWKLCRIEMICCEISTLQSKFEMKLEKDDVNDAFMLTFIFTGKKQSTKLRVSFNLHESYPNAPADICIQPLIGGDKFDVNALSRHLQNTVNPGFGYATRLCNAVKSYLD